MEEFNCCTDCRYYRDDYDDGVVRKDDYPNCVKGCVPVPYCRTDCRQFKPNGLLFKVWRVIMPILIAASLLGIEMLLCKYLIS